MARPLLTIEDRAERQILWATRLSWAPWIIALLYFGVTIVSTRYGTAYQQSALLSTFGLCVIWSVALIPILMIALPLLAAFNWHFMTVRDRVVVMLFGFGGCVICLGIIILLTIGAIMSGT